MKHTLAGALSILLLSAAASAQKVRGPRSFTSIVGVPVMGPGPLVALTPLHLTLSPQYATPSFRPPRYSVNSPVPGLGASALPGMIPPLPTSAFTPVPVAALAAPLPAAAKGSMDAVTTNAISKLDPSAGSDEDIRAAGDALFDARRRQLQADDNAGPPSNWRSSRPEEALLQLPALGSLGLNPANGTLAPIPALLRVLDASAVSPRGLSSTPEAIRPKAIQSAVAAYGESLIQEAARLAKAGADIGALSELDAAHARLEDLEQLIGMITQAEPTMPARLRQAHERVLTHFRAESARLVADAARTLQESEDVTWHGRTAVVDIGEGNKAAFKFETSLRPLDPEQEGRRMSDVRRYGLQAPLPLPDALGLYAHPAIPLRDGESRGRFLAYLLPADLADPFFKYLNDPLPSTLSPALKAERIEKAALKAVDQLVLLRRNGVNHESLAAISHGYDTNPVHWDWHYWRVRGTYYGPTDIMNWRNNRLYSNLRYSGLADYEHIAEVETFMVRGHPGAPIIFRKDQATVGQNLTELSLIILDAASPEINAIDPERTTDIILNVILTHARGFLSPEKLRDLNPYSMRRYIRSTVARFNRDNSLNALSGRVLEPLIMHVLKPYVRKIAP